MSNNSDSSPDAQGETTRDEDGDDVLQQRKPPYLERLTNETPRKSRPSLSDAYQNGTVDDMRDVLVEENRQHILEIEIDLFITHILPPLKAGISVESIMSSMKSEDGSLISSKEGTWKSFLTNPAKRSNEVEDDVFAPLSDICERATLHASKTTSLEPRFILALLPNIKPVSERESTTRPDAYFLPKEFEELAKHAVKGRTKKKDDGTRKLTQNRRKVTTKIVKQDKKLSWYDIAVAGEFKKDETDASLEDNHKKQLFNQQQIMALDASRRFVFGFTIENTSMRLWFCSRSNFLVSTSFNFITEMPRLLHIFLSFAFATREELGWDPTIQPFQAKDGTRQFKIDVDNKTYITERLLSDVAADALLSRATRVWLVRLADSELRFVLKDVWIEDGRDLEHEIYEKILDDIEKKYDKGVRTEAALHLLTPVAHWVVQVDGEVDGAARMLMKDYIPSSKSTCFLKVRLPKYTDKKQGVGPPGAGDTETSSSEKRDADSHSILVEAEVPPFRKHYRIIFREAAQVLYTVRNLSNVFKVLRDSAKVLNWIHGCGWVHRDIGAGNLYFLDGRGLMGDLEYAKRKDSEAAHVIRTNKAEFMAVESANQEYHFTPRLDVNPHDAAAAWLSGNLEESNSEETTFNLATSPPFSHNDLHDLESLWWTAVYELFFNRDSSSLEVNGEQARQLDKQRQTITGIVFSRSASPEARLRFLGGNGEFERKIVWMCKSFDNIKAILNTLRILLIHAYEHLEAKFPILQPDAFDGMQEWFRKLFDKCIIFADGIHLVPYKVTGSRFTSSDDENVYQACSVTFTVIEELVEQNQACSEPSGSSRLRKKCTMPSAYAINVSPRPSTMKRKLDNDDDSKVMPPSRIPKYDPDSKDHNAAGIIH